MAHGLRETLPVSVRTRHGGECVARPALKSKHAIAYANAFAAATAVEFNAILLTGDPKLELLNGCPDSVDRAASAAFAIIQLRKSSGIPQPIPTSSIL